MLKPKFYLVAGLLCSTLGAGALDVSPAAAATVRCENPSTGAIRTFNTRCPTHWRIVHPANQMQQQSSPMHTTPGMQSAPPAQTSPGMQRTTPSTGGGASGGSSY